MVSCSASTPGPPAAPLGPPGTCRSYNIAKGICNFCEKSVDNIKDSTPWLSCSLRKTWFLSDNPSRVWRILHPACNFSYVRRVSFGQRVESIKESMPWLSCSLSKTASLPDNPLRVLRIMHRGCHVPYVKSRFFFRTFRWEYDGFYTLVVMFLL